MDGQNQRPFMIRCEHYIVVLEVTSDGYQKVSDTL